MKEVHWFDRLKWGKSTCANSAKVINSILFCALTRSKDATLAAAFGILRRLFLSHH